MCEISLLYPMYKGYKYIGKYTPELCIKPMKQLSVTFHCVQHQNIIICIHL